MIPPSAFPYNFDTNENNISEIDDFERKYRKAVMACQG
jgi:hypothetical protein